MDGSREVEERRFGAIQALTAVVDCLKATNPAVVFAQPKGGDAALEPMKLQSINNRWADKAADVLLKALQLAEAVGDDGLALFNHPPMK